MRPRPQPHPEDLAVGANLYRKIDGAWCRWNSVVGEWKPPLRVPVDVLDEIAALRRTPPILETPNANT